MISPSNPHIYEMHGTRIRVNILAIWLMAAVALFMAIAWIVGQLRGPWYLLLSVIFAGYAGWAAFTLRSQRRLRFRVDDEGISVIQDTTEIEWISWKSVKAARSHPHGLKLLGDGEGELVDFSDELRGFDELRVFALSKIDQPPRAVVAASPAGLPAAPAYPRRYQRDAHLAGSVGFALLLAAGGCFFLYLAIELDGAFAIGTFLAVMFLAFQVPSFVFAVTAIEIAPEQLVIEYPWRKRAIQIADIKALAFSDFITGRGQRVWRVALTLRDGRTITLRSRELGVSEAELYRELSAVAPGAVRGARPAL